MKKILAILAFSVCFLTSSHATNILVVRYDITSAAMFEPHLTTLGYTYTGVDRPTFEGTSVATLITQYDAVVYIGGFSGDSFSKAIDWLLSFCSAFSGNSGWNAANEIKSVSPLII